MKEKIATALWFAQRPNFWEHGFALAKRKFLSDYDTPELSARANAWAADRVVPVETALKAIGIDGQPPTLNPAVLQAAKEHANKAIKMGGPGDLDLLYAAVYLTNAASVVETGVAYGWSSLAILAAMADSGCAHTKQLISVDMPYPKMGNEAFVGIVVPDNLRRNWVLIREPDRRGLEKALACLKAPLDFCHYDSDKSWRGRKYAYPLLWGALKSGGIFISDDIQDNMAFAEFVEEEKVPFAVTGYEGKFIGICRKP